MELLLFHANLQSLSKTLAWCSWQKEVKKEYYFGPVLCRVWSTEFANTRETSAILCWLMRGDQLGSRRDAKRLWAFHLFCGEMKTKVVPIYKNVDKHIVSNYRPYCLNFLKYKEIFVTRLDNFIEKNKLLNDHKYVFRTNRSTSLPIMEFV